MSRAISQIDSQSPKSPGSERWLRYANLKIEAGLFLLILVTFAAVLGQSAITTQKVTLAPGGGSFVPYVFSDAQDGGASSAVLDARKALTWSCKIRKTVEYPFCGFGLQLNIAQPDEGVNLSHIKTVTLRFNYHGAAERMRLSMQTGLPEPVMLRTGVKNLALATEFPVVNGRNEVTLPLDLLAPESWFVAQNHLSSEDARPNFSNVQTVALVTSSANPSELDASIEEIIFEGAFLTTAQWYLIILGAWLVATGSFLVHRFFNMRRRYEERRLRHAAQAKVLGDAYAAAEAASRAKSQFLSNMSHELRTPLNAVIGYAYWLGHRDLGPREREAASTILSSGEHLLAVISDILDIAKVEAGKLDLLPVAFDLRECISSIDRMMRLKAEEKALDFEANVAPDVPASVVADQKRIRQVLINLLGNAVKFTPSGRVALSVSVVSGHQGAWRLRFVVEDSGIGIPQDHIHSIFQPFEQVGNAVDRSGGTGLGLSITKQIIDLMGGMIQVESAPGEGSRFVVEVMVGAVDSPALEAPATISRLAAPDTSMAAPDGPTLQHLLTLARTGNMGALRREAARIKAEDPRHTSFADKLDTLCAAYQSPAVLRLIESLVAQEVAQ